MTNSFQLYISTLSVKKVPDENNVVSLFHDHVCNEPLRDAFFVLFALLEKAST